MALASANPPDGVPKPARLHEGTQERMETNLLFAASRIEEAADGAIERVGEVALLEGLPETGAG